MTEFKLSFKDRLFLSTLHFLGRRSLKSLYRLGRVFYWLILGLPFGFKKTIRTNLNKCLQDVSLVNETIFHTIIRMLEMPFFWFAPKEAVSNSLIAVINEAAFKEAYQQKKGVIVLAPHLGAWEMVNTYIAERYPSVSLYKPVKKAYQEVLIKHARERTGVTMLPTTVAGVKGLYAALKAGKCVGILPDHDPGKNGGLYVPFFGVLANTTTLIAKFAQKSQAALFFVYAERLAGGQGFKLHFMPGTERMRSDNQQEAVTALNEGIEACVKQIPAQYEWSYKRFRRRPQGESAFY